MPRFVTCNTGWIEAITGPMFSGKSEELIRRLVRAQIAGQRVAVFKPSLDDRFSETKIVSRSGAEMDCQVVNLEFDDIDSLSELKKSELDKDVYAFDEAQFFFGPTLVAVCSHLANSGKRVLVAGLDTDFTGTPFVGGMPDILAAADFVDKLNAVCVDCGGVATKTARIIDSSEMVVIGDTETYKAVCRECHKKYLGEDRC